MPSKKVPSKSRADQAVDALLDQPLGRRLAEKERDTRDERDGLLALIRIAQRHDVFEAGD